MHNKNAKIKRASLNHTYRLVWSDAKQMYIAVAEIAPGKGKRKGGIVGAIAALMMGFGGIAHALDPGTLPEGANIVHGQAQIQQHNNVMTIHQTSDKLITNWNSFNIGQDATVNFQQPNSNSAALNRVMDNNPSQIHGRLNANGNVYLVNPSGILFGKTAQVDVGGLIASTLEISDQDFLDNKLDFKNLGFSEGDIKNLGHIRANGGVVALIANRVSNQGTIEANNGNVALAAGDHVTLDFNGDGLMTVTVEQGVLDALAENGGLIQADGGFVIMTTQARQDIYRNLVNNDGLIQAQTFASKSGRIMLMGGMSQGQVTASGKLDASAPNGGDGGFIETSAANVNIQPGLVVTTKAEQGKTGEWLIDPTDIEIVAGTGGDFADDASGSTQIGADTLVANLANNNITIQTPSEGTEQGHITINAPLEWTNTTLTLIAHGHININAELDVRGMGGLVLTHGQGRRVNTGLSEEGFYGKVNFHDHSTLRINDQDYTLIRDYNSFSALRSAGSVGLYYALAVDIDASKFPVHTSFLMLETGTFLPGPFKGTLNGMGHVVSNQTISPSSGTTSGHAGLFAVTEGATLLNFGLDNLTVTKQDLKTGYYQDSIGGLVGLAKGVYPTTIANSFVRGRFDEVTDRAGGLVGSGKVSIINSFSDVELNLTGSFSHNIGGLVGVTNPGSGIHASFSKVTFNNEAENTSDIGGLVGGAWGPSITASYALVDGAGSKKIEDLGLIAGGMGEGDSGIYVIESYGVFDSDPSQFATNYGILGRVDVDDEHFASISYIDFAYYLDGQMNYDPSQALLNLSLIGNKVTLDQLKLSNNDDSLSLPLDPDPHPLNYMGTEFSKEWSITSSKNDGMPYHAWQNKPFSEPVVDTCAVVAGMPNCGEIKSGTGTINDIVDTNGVLSRLINQDSDKLIIDWRNFDIGTGNSVEFVQPSASAVALNRVVQNNPSSILGNLTANGRVYLINPSGILFGTDAQVDVAGLVASNLNITNTDFEAGNLSFLAPLSASYVSIQGDTSGWSVGELTLASASDFVVGADAPSETESGISNTALQHRLAAGDVKVIAQNTSGSGGIDLNAAIEWDADNALTLKADTIKVNAKIENQSTAGGGVYFAAKNESDAVVFSEDGKVVIHNAEQLQWINTALNGTYQQGSDIDLSGLDWMPIASRQHFNDSNPPFTGKFDGQHKTISNLTVGGAGQKYVGLFGYTKGAQLTNIHLDNVMATGSQYVGSLVGFMDGYSDDELNVLSNIIIENATVEFKSSAADNESGTYIGGVAGSAHVKQLNNVVSNAEVSAWNEFGSLGSIGGMFGNLFYTGESATVDLTNHGNLTLVTTGEHFSIQNVGGIVGDLSINNIDAQLIALQGWTMNGNVTLVSINASVKHAGGLIGDTSGSIVNITQGVMNGDIKTHVVIDNEQLTALEGYIFGGLVGRVTGTVSDSTMNGNLALQFLKESEEGYWNTFGFGGVAGYVVALNGSTPIDNVHFHGELVFENTGAPQEMDGFAVGGLIGYISSQPVTISNSTVTGRVSGVNSVGGLVGEAWEKLTITNSHFLGDSIVGHDYVGGLVGNVHDFYGPIGDQMTITDSSSTGTITGHNYVGGLVGKLPADESWDKHQITRSYSTANIEGNDNVGGLVGYLFNGEITESFAATQITATGSNVGGLVGVLNGSSIKNAYATAWVEGADNVGGLVGRVEQNTQFGPNSAIEHTYADVSVVHGADATVLAGGLVGKVNAGSFITLSQNFWNADFAVGLKGIGSHSDASTPGAWESKTSAELTEFELFETADWVIEENQLLASGYPQLNVFLPQGQKVDGGAIWQIAPGSSSCVVTPGMPNCGEIKSGAGTIHDIVDTNGVLSRLINQDSDKLIIDWRNFDIGVGNSVHFDQNGNASWVALNRVTANNPSSILGKLTADGRVYLINPSGILFGTDAQVDVAGLVASNLNISNTDFEAGNLNFSAPTRASYVSIQGDTAGWSVGELTLASASDFVVGADAPAETESGISNTALQHRLAAGDAKVIAQNTGGSGAIDLNAAIEWDSDNALILKADTIKVNAKIANTSNNDGGVRFNAGNTSDKVVFTNDGLVEIYNINQLQRINQALAGDYSLGKNVNASGTNGWNSGAGWQPIGDIMSYFSGRFDGNNKEISGLFINRPDQDYQGLFGVVNGAESSITNLDLHAPSVVGRNYVGTLVGSVNGGTIEAVRVFNPTVVGEHDVGGMLGHNFGSIRDVWVVCMDRSCDKDDGPKITGIDGVGGLMGGSHAGPAAEVDNAFTAIRVYGNKDVGGLIGLNDGATVSNSIAIGDVFGVKQDDVNPQNIGGLVGRLEFQTVENSYATGNVSSPDGERVGGLVGFANYGKLNRSYFIGNTVDGDQYIGGLVGYLSYGEITESFAATHVTATGSNVGGLVGFLSGSSIKNAYATGKVHGADNVGGLVGEVEQSGEFGPWSAIEHTYADVAVTHGEGDLILAGALIGNANRINPLANFWNADVAVGLKGVGNYRSVSYSGIWEPKTSTELTEFALFKTAGWEISAQGSEDTVWRSYDGMAAPLLRHFFSEIVTVTGTQQADQASRVYDATTDVTLAAADLSWTNDGQAITPNQDWVLETDYRLDSKNVGTRQLIGGLYSTQLGYDIIDETSRETVEITKANLMVTGLTAEDKVYDAKTSAILNGTATVAAFGSDSVSLSGQVVGAFFDKNVAENKAITLSGISLMGDDADNYTLVVPDNLVATITAKDLVVSGLTAQGKVYDGSKVATIVINGVEYAGLVAGDDLTINATGEFADKNVGENKTVSITSEYSGADVGNYKITNQTSTTASITAKDLIISGLTAQGKVYDGSKVATIVIDGVEYAGLVSGDKVAISATGEFDNKNVGENKEVTISSSYSGADIGNYKITDQTTTTASITAKELIISGLTAQGKVYDGSKVATIVINGVEFAGLVKDDDVTISATGEFDDKNVGVDKEVTITSTYSGADVNNYTIQNQATTTASITAKDLIISGLTAEGKVYDGSKVATIVINGVEYAGLVENDEVNISATGAFDDKNVGENKTVTITSDYSGADVGNYNITDQTTAKATITAKDLIISGLTAQGKVYDGSKVATIVINGVQYAGLVEDDDVSISATGEFDDKNVGVDKEVTITSTYSGADVNNYTIQNQATTTASITAKDLIISGLTAEGKVYDGNRIATIVINGVQYAGLVENDEVSISASGEFDDKNVGENKTVTISSTYSGADIGNYKITSQTTTTASITAKDLIISGLTAQGKVYDGSKVATIVIDGVEYVGLVENDEVSISATGEFDNKNAGVDKEVTITSTYSGADVGNYKITNQTSTTASITAKELIISGLTAEGKVYDGNRIATIVIDGVQYAGLVEKDEVSISATGEFDDKNVGENKTVTITSELSGADLGNYKITNQATTTATITAKDLIISGLTAQGKVYDGAKVATIVINGVEYAGLVAGDDLTINATGEFADKNVGVDKEVTITSNYEGVDVGNYNIQHQETTTATITAKELIISGLTAEGKVYDGSKVATIVINGVEFAGLVEKDEVNISATGEFADKNVGENKTVTITSELSGADLGNYKITNQTSTTASITAKELIISGLTAEGKVYDGNRIATIVIDGVQYAGLVEKDEVSISATGEFDDKNVGENKTVSITSEFSGADVGNYKITNQATTTASITAKDLIISGLTAEGKVYDGNRIATIVIDGVEYAGLVGKDDVKVSATGEFADKNVGENKTVTITSTYSGADIGNYKITNQTTTTATITAKDLIISGLTAEGKVYDGNRIATIVIDGVQYAGLVENDEVSISATGEFSDKNVGVDKVVTIASTYSGADVANYTIQNQATTTASITAKDLIISGLTAEGKVYDGSKVATIVINGVEFAGLVEKDEVNISATGEFADKNVGENKTVTITSELSGADLGNYKITNQTSTTASITAKDLIISGLTAEGKVYDGNRIATIVIDGVQYAGLVENDEVSISATGEFSDKNVGVDKVVTIASTYSGADVANYTIQNQTTTTATITAKDLIISGLTAEGKVYDGNRIATIVIDGVEYAGLIENDEVNISATGEFDDKNVGVDKEVTITSTYSGADVNNYTIQNQATTMASITPKGLTISGMSAEDKFYDGNTRATLLGGELVGVVAGERLSFTGQSGQFASIAVGTHDVSVSGLSLVALENADINNYTVSIPENIRATINPQAGTDTGAQQRDTVVNVPEAQTPVLTSTPSLVADARAADGVADAIPAPVAAPAEPVAAEPVEVETVEAETVEAETVEAEVVETQTTAAEPAAVIDQPVVRSSSVTINGETVALSFSQTAEVATLEVGDASMATDEVIQPGLAIYESSGGTTRLDSVVDISDRGNSVSATAGSADTAQASIEMSSPVVEQTSISLTNEEGIEETMEVSLLEDGTLVIDMPANASVSDSRQATLMGVAAAKRAGVSVDRLKAVVINRR